MCPGGGAGRWDHTHTHTHTHAHTHPSPRTAAGGAAPAQGRRRGADGARRRRRRRPGPGPRRQAPPARAEALPAGPGRAGPAAAAGAEPRAPNQRGRGGSGALSAAAAERGQSSPPATATSIPARPLAAPPRSGDGTGTGTGTSGRLPAAPPPSPPPLSRGVPATASSSSSSSSSLLLPPLPPPPPPAAAAPGHVDAAVVRVHAGAGRLRVRGAAAGGEPGEAGPVPLVAAGLRPPAQERERPEGQGGGGLPPRQLPRALQDPGEPPVLPPQPPQAAAALAQGSLRGSREAAGQTLGRRRQVPRPPKIPFAPHHLGRRGDQLLLQGEVPGRAAGMVRPQPLPVPPGEAGVGRSHRAHHHPGQQLVQEPEAAGPSGGGEGKGEHGKQQRGHQQTQPALASGWEQTPHVQLRGRVFSSPKPGSELSVAAAGEPQPPQGLRLLPGRLSHLPDPSQPPGPPAPGLAAGTPHVQPGGSGVLRAGGGRAEERERKLRSGTQALACT